MAEQDGSDLAQAVKPHVEALNDLAARAEQGSLDLTTEDLNALREHAVAVKELRDEADDPDLRAGLNDVLAQFGALAERLQAQQADT